MTVTDTTVLEAVLRRDRFVVVTALVAVIVVAWIWIVLGAGTGMSAVAMTQMAGMPDMDMMMERAVWTPGYAALILAMWWVMMVAMMLPSAAPMLLLFARVNRAQKGQDRPYVPTGIFAAGYLAAWGGFSALATGLQWGLEELDLLSPMMTTTNYWLGGAILLAAGAWQLTPIKGVCLRHCRSPLSFLAQKWRRGLGHRVARQRSERLVALPPCGRGPWRPPRRRQRQFPKLPDQVPPEAPVWLFAHQAKARGLIDAAG